MRAKKGLVQIPGMSFTCKKQHFRYWISSNPVTVLVSETDVPRIMDMLNIHTNTVVSGEWHVGKETSALIFSHRWQEKGFLRTGVEPATLG
jgi:hypothetical protein